MTKPQELFLFFTIKQPSKFKAGLRKTIIPMITSVTEVLKRDSNGCQAIVNIGFSATGLQKLDVKDSLNDTFFSGGQFNDSKTLGDVNPDYNWLKAFRGTHIHGVLLIASSSGDVISETRAKIHHALGSSISVAHTLHGAARKGSEVGHERKSFPSSRMVVPDAPKTLDSSTASRSQRSKDTSPHSQGSPSSFPARS
jgi:hypothetical protein